MHHVCLCDTSKLGPRACRTPANWHDLGELELQPASDRFPKQPPLNRILLAVGGDLLETYAWKDVLSIRNAAPSPDLVMATDHNNPYHRGADALHELCSQKCLRNDRCRGFSMTLTVSVAGMHQGYRDALQNVQCALKGDKVQLRDVANADSSLSTFRWYHQRQEVLDEEWHYFPQINFHSSGPGEGHPRQSNTLWPRGTTGWSSMHRSSRRAPMATTSRESYRRRCASLMLQSTTVHFAPPRAQARPGAPLRVARCFAMAFMRWKVPRMKSVGTRVTAKSLR